MSALALKILSEGNMGDHKKLRVVSLSTYVWKNLLCNEDTLWASSLEMIIGNCVCVSFALGLENSVREMRVIRISCVWFLCPVMFGIGM